MHHSYHERLVTRFDTDLPLSVKKFWFIAAMLDPRFKKLKFDGDGLLRDARRRDAIRWLTEEYNSKFKGKVHDPSDAAAMEEAAPAAAEQGSSSEDTHTKRRKVASCSFFQPRVAGHARSAAANPAPVPKTDEAKPHTDELKAYLALPQIENSSEWAGLDWWKENEKYFPNLAVMARQYFGCPATSATVERLFSAVGIAFSKLRKSSKAETLSNIAFTNLNVE